MTTPPRAGNQGTDVNLQANRLPSVKDRKVWNHKLNIPNPGLSYKIFKEEEWWMNAKVSHFLYVSDVF